MTSGTHKTTTTAIPPCTLLCLLLQLAAGAAADAGVNLKNGNFYITYTDLIVEDITFARTYNSMSSRVGMFGYGWGSLFDTYLAVEGDLTITVHETGSGAMTQYLPADFQAFDVDDKVRQMVDVLVAERRFSGPGHVAAYRARILTDEERRNGEWQRLVACGLVAASPLPVGGRLDARGGGSHVIVSEDGFDRYEDGRIDRFDVEGRLVRITKPNGDYRRLRYGPRGRLVEVSNQDGRRVRVIANDRGRIEYLIPDRGAGARFRYEGNRLVESVDAIGNVFRFEYDERVNMTAIIYVDESSRRMTYNARSRIASQRDRQGALTTYGYGGDSTLDYWTEEKAFDPEGTEQSSRRLHYFQWVDERGAQQVYRIVETVDDETRTRGSRPPGRPVRLATPDGEFRFAYDERGFCTRLESNDEIVTARYGDDRDHRPVEVTRRDKDDDTVRSVRFEYDTNGSLSLIAPDGEEAFELRRDDEDSITEIASGDVAIGLRWEDGLPVAFVLGDETIGLSDEEDRERPTGPAVATIDAALTRLIAALEIANGLNAYCRSEDCSGDHGETGDIAFLRALRHAIRRDGE